AAARLGTRGTRALHDLMGKVAPGIRRRIAAALAAAGTPSAEIIAVDTLLDSDPGVVDAAVRTLIAEVPSLSDAHRRTLANHLRCRHRLPRGCACPDDPASAAGHRQDDSRLAEAVRCRRCGRSAPGAGEDRRP